MATAMTFEFPQLDRVATEGSNSDVVKTIHWRITCISDSDKGPDGNYLAKIKYGTTSVGYEPGASFVSYDSITKDWCKAKVLAALDQTESELKADLDADIAEQKTPTILTGTPSGW